MLIVTLGNTKAVEAQTPGPMLPPSFIVVHLYHTTASRPDAIDPFA